MYLPLFINFELDESQRDENENIVCYITNSNNILYNENIPGIDIIFVSKKNTVIIYQGNYDFVSCKFIIKGDNNFIKIQKSKNKIRGLLVEIKSKNQKLIIDDDFSLSSGNIYMKENSSVYIGKDCMFSNGIKIFTSDMHSIIDLNGNRINNSGDVIIGNHVWLCQDVKVLKNSKISDNTIVGHSAIVTKKFYETNVILAGNPARIVKRGVNWDRKII